MARRHPTDEDSLKAADGTPARRRGIGASARIDDRVLRRLRQLVAAVRETQGAPLLQRRLAELAKDIDIDGTVTVDFEAARELGQPMIVLRSVGGAELGPGFEATSNLQRLSRRERQVAGLVARGMANREIAGELGISLATVKDHVHHILAKTGHRSRAGIIADVLASGASPRS